MGDRITCFTLTRTITSLNGWCFFMDEVFVSVERSWSLDKVVAFGVDVSSHTIVSISKGYKFPNTYPGLSFAS